MRRCLLLDATISASIHGWMMQRSMRRYKDVGRCDDRCVDTWISGCRPITAAMNDIKYNTNTSVKR
jgi:hypothetical protein